MTERPGVIEREAIAVTPIDKDNLLDDHSLNNVNIHAITIIVFEHIINIILINRSQDRKEKGTETIE
jgi:hypothetical protein